MPTDNDLSGVLPDEVNSPSPAEIVSDELVKPLPPGARVLTTGSNSVLIGVAPSPVPEVIEAPLERVAAQDDVILPAVTADNSATAANR